ncbi:MAG: lipocalin-like domain-containing protein [Crocinitomicaceae bacterium]
MTKLLIAFLLCTFLACTDNIKPKVAVETVTEPIEGLWNLQTMELKDDAGNWSEWRDGMKGYLLYDGKGHMALHLIPSDYEKTTLEFPNFTDTISIDALRYITNNYNYFGTYKIDYDSSIVSHYKISHSNPGEWFTTARRKFSFKGDTLIVRPVEEKNAKLRLKFLKED